MCGDRKILGLEFVDVKDAQIPTQENPQSLEILIVRTRRSYWYTHNTYTMRLGQLWALYMLY